MNDDTGFSSEYESGKVITNSVQTEVERETAEDQIENAITYYGSSKPYRITMRAEVISD